MSHLHIEPAFVTAMNYAEAGEYAGVEPGTAVHMRDAIGGLCSRQRKVDAALRRASASGDSVRVRHLLEEEGAQPQARSPGKRYNALHHAAACNADVSGRGNRCSRRPRSRRHMSRPLRHPTWRPNPGPCGKRRG